MNAATTRETVRRSFLAGYSEVRAGKITAELTPAEVETKYPHYISTAFSEGMLDALHMDSFRYYGLLSKDI